MKPYEQYFKTLTAMREKMISNEHNFQRLLGICFNQNADDPKQRDIEMNRLIKEQSGNLKMPLNH
jgi:hypothetical protein